MKYITDEEPKRKERIVMRNNIMAGYAAQCVLTGKHFDLYWPASFFLDGDLDKPVCAEAAFRHGFTTDTFDHLQDMMFAHGQAIRAGLQKRDEYERACAAEVAAGVAPF